MISIMRWVPTIRLTCLASLFSLTPITIGPLPAACLLTAEPCISTALSIKRSWTERVEQAVLAVSNSFMPLSITNELKLPLLWGTIPLTNMFRPTVALWPLSMKFTASSGSTQSRLRR